MEMANSPYVFTSSQLEVFREICLGRKTVREIAQFSDQSIKTVYRITEILRNSGILTASGSHGAHFTPSTDLRSAALKRYLLSEKHPVDAITGSKLLLLLSISQMPKSIDRISKETCLKYDTVRVLAWALKNYGVVTQTRDEIVISPTAASITQFLQDFSKGMNLRIMEQRTKVGILTWSGGLECIFSTRALDDSSNVKKTGISAMGSYGLRFITENDYYYYSNWNSDLRPEDIAIHNILTNPFSSTVIGYSILFLKRTGFDSDYLLEVSRDAGIEELVKDMTRAMAGEVVKNKFIPTPDDMRDLSAQYGVS